MEWKLLTAGRLTRNKFWRESDLLAYRPVVATSTLILDGNTNILVDPSLPIKQMDALLRGKVMAVAYETIQEKDRSLPCLAPMPERGGH